MRAGLIEKRNELPYVRRIHNTIAEALSQSQVVLVDATPQKFMPCSEAIAG